MAPFSQARTFADAILLMAWSSDFTAPSRYVRSASSSTSVSFSSSDSLAKRSAPMLLSRCLLEGMGGRRGGEVSHAPKPLLKCLREGVACVHDVAQVCARAQRGEKGGGLLPACGA
eukprot:364488-Chlamydomonas_euryale.AAC.1